MSPTANNRTLNAQLRALANTALCLGAVFMVLLCTFVFLVTRIKAKDNDSKSEETTTVTTSATLMDTTPSTEATTTTTEAPTETTAAPTAHASYPEGTKLIALTFDDGPCENTSKVLDVLEKNGVVATFFVLGGNINETYAKDLQRMLDLNCEIGNHTYGHTVLSKVDADQAYNELQKCDDALMKYIGQKATVIRPPQGAGLVNTGLFKYSLDNHEYVINWNDASTPADWQKPALGDAHYTAQYVVDNCTMSDCVLLHECHNSTTESLQEMIDGLKAKGYTFVTVSELLEARTANLTIDHAGSLGWDTSTLAEAYPGGPIYGIRYAYSCGELMFENGPKS